MKKMNLYIGSNATNNDNRENCNHDNATKKKRLGTNNHTLQQKKVLGGGVSLFNFEYQHIDYSCDNHMQEAMMMNNKENTLVCIKPHITSINNGKNMARTTHKKRQGLPTKNHTL